MNDKNAIEIIGLTKHYAGFSMDELNLALPQGAILGLVGANGAGKTTLIRLIMNAARREAGSIQVLGADNQSASFAEIKQDIGIVLDESHFPEVLTARQLAHTLRSAYRNWNDEQFNDYLYRFGLPDNQPFKTFSRGMKMKLALAAALSHDAKLLILDEATSGLDPVAREEILDILFEFTRREDRSILLSSHIVSDLEKICDYIAFMSRGKLLLTGEKDTLLQEYALLQTTAETLEAIPPEAIIGRRSNPYGVQVLVRRSMVNAAFPLEHTTLEDIIVFFAREVEQV